jgi:hypothetical protein
VARPTDGAGGAGVDIPGAGEGRRTRPGEGGATPDPGVGGRVGAPGGGPTCCQGGDDVDVNDSPGTGGTLAVLLSSGLAPPAARPGGITGDGARPLEAAASLASASNAISSSEVSKTEIIAGVRAVASSSGSSNSAGGCPAETYAPVPGPAGVPGRGMPGRRPRARSLCSLACTLRACVTSSRRPATCCSPAACPAGGRASTASVPGILDVFSEARTSGTAPSGPSSGRSAGSGACFGSVR